VAGNLEVIPRDLVALLRWITMILGQPMSRTRAQIKKAEHEVLLLSSFWLWLTKWPSSAALSASPSAPVASQQSSFGLLPT